MSVPKSLLTSVEIIECLVDGLDVAPAHSGIVFAHFAHPTPTPRPQLAHKMPTNEIWNHIQNRALYHRIASYGPSLAAEWALCGRFEHACGPNAAGGSNSIEYTD